MGPDTEKLRDPYIVAPYIHRSDADGVFDSKSLGTFTFHEDA